MLVDDITLKVMAGNGGNGKVSFLHLSGNYKGGPDGGNGGNGGSVYFVGVNDITALRNFRYKKSVKAEDGIGGGKRNLFGRNGEHLEVKIPLGTTVTNIQTGQVFEITDTTTKHLVARGGIGGKGNNEFKSATNQTPRYADPGTPGEKFDYKLELGLIADIGFIGLPNAGKSSLLAVLTNANPKIGNYAFTTLEPNLGALDGMILADIPGLIEGASTGRGLGTKFLRHIEKTKMLVHFIDATLADPLKTYHIVRKELEEYGHALTNKKELILLTKTDLIDKETLGKRIKDLKTLGKQIETISIYNEADIEKLKKLLLTQAS